MGAIYYIKNQLSNIRLLNLVRMFFAYFAHWQWPSPVTITPIYTSRELKLYSWEPRVSEFRNAYSSRANLNSCFFQ